MEFTSITNIRTIRDQIRERLSSIDKNTFADQKFGPEGEYTYKGLLGGIDSLLIDISSLTKAPNQFVKLSTNAERVNIHALLQNILAYIDQPQNLWSQIESLKISIRPYNIRHQTERFIEFNNELDKLVQKKQEFEQLVIESKASLEEVKQVKSDVAEKFDEIISKKQELDEKLTELEEEQTNLEKTLLSAKQLDGQLTTIKELAEENLDEIKLSTTNAQANEKLITAFAVKVQERENRLDQIENSTQNYLLNLLNYSTERDNIIRESQVLVASAKLALNYKTAEGISAAFQERYENANSHFRKWPWLVGSILSLLVTLAIGVWVVWENNSSTLNIIIGRIALLPFPIAGAIFCANQFVKQKNIIEDYAYKMVLSKAIVGFSEQIKKHGTDEGQEYIHYIKIVLEEIHKDPLRDRNFKERKSQPVEFDKLMEMVERCVKIKKEL